MKAAATTGVLDQLNKAASAEEFFEILSVAYDPKHVNVVRLHILRRMGQYLVSENFDGLDDTQVTERCRSVLAQAYADFLASSPLDQRVFKVLKDAVKPATPAPKHFVSLDVLK